MLTMTRSVCCVSLFLKYTSIISVLKQRRLWKDCALNVQEYIKQSNQLFLSDAFAKMEHFLFLYFISQAWLFRYGQHIGILVTLFLVYNFRAFNADILKCSHALYMRNLHLQNEIRDAVFGKRRKLRQAFDILKIRRDGKDIITHSIWIAIMSRVLPKRSKEQLDLLMVILDLDGQRYISKACLIHLTRVYTFILKCNNKKNFSSFLSRHTQEIPLPIFPKLN